MFVIIVSESRTDTKIKLYHDDIGNTVNKMNPPEIYLLKTQNNFLKLEEKCHNFKMIDFVTLYQGFFYDSKMFAPFMPKLSELLF